MTEGKDMEPDAASGPPGTTRGTMRRHRSPYRWRLRWGRPLPWSTRVEVLATLGLWLAGAWGWEKWGKGSDALQSPVSNASPTARTVAAVAPLLTADRPDADGLFAYRQDRLLVRVPVALRQAPRQGERPDLSRARGQEGDGLRFELSRVFDPRARSADATDLAHEQAAVICRAANAALLDATDVALVIAGAGESAVHTLVHARLASGKGLTIEGLTFDDPAGPVTWTLWAGYPSDNRRAAALVRESFASVKLEPLTAETGKGDRD